MIASRVASRLIQSNKLSLFAQLRNNSTFIQASPPRNKLSTGELWVMGTILVAGVFGPSVYFAINMQEYNGKAEQRRKGVSE